VSGDARARMVDVAFALHAPEGAASLPQEHRHTLAAALDAALPWWAGEPDAGVHRMNLAGGAQALLSQRTRLTLRVPRVRASDALSLQGSELRLGAARLRVGRGQVRELLPWGTLYAHLVAAEQEDEAGFLGRLQAALAVLQVGCRLVCGRHQVVEGGQLHGYSLMLDGLSGAAALQMLDTGLGAHRRLGCGLFVPHKSAAAVGAPP
jgi:CRISPR-associated protein Cas6